MCNRSGNLFFSGQFIVKKILRSYQFQVHTTIFQIMSFVVCTDENTKFVNVFFAVYSISMFSLYQNKCACFISKILYVKEQDYNWAVYYMDDFTVTISYFSQMRKRLTSGKME